MEKLHKMIYVIAISFLLIFICIFIPPPIAPASLQSNQTINTETNFSVDTEWKLIGPNHKIVVERLQDPDYPNILIFFSQAKPGGIGGVLGISEKPSRFDIAVVKIGEAIYNAKFDDNNGQKQIFKKSASLIFKTIRIDRYYDKYSNSLVYMASSYEIIEGSPFNAISVIRLD